MSTVRADRQKIGKSFVFAILVLALGLAGCSTTGARRASDYTITLKTSQDVGKVWKAGIEVLPEIRYTAISTSATSGFILAEQATGKNQKATLQIRVSKSSGSTLVAVDYVAPAGGPSDHAAADQFAAALKKRIPDLEQPGK